MRAFRSTPLLLITLGALVMTACPKGAGIFPGGTASGVPSKAPASAVPASGLPTAKPSEIPVVEGTLKGDMPLAFRTASNWAADATLYEIEGLFIDATGKRDPAGTSAWNFRYAAGSQAGKLFTVNISGANKVVSQISDGQAPFATFSRTAIGVDSTLACRVAKATGKEVRLNVLHDSRLGLVVYLFPELDRKRVDAFTGDVLTQ